MVKNLAAIAGDVRDVGLIPESEDPLEEGMPIHSIILAWRTHGQRNLASYGPLGRTESDMIKLLSSSGPLYEYTTFMLDCKNVGNCMLTF